MRTAALTVIACGRAKVWDTDPQAGPQQARDAYTGTPFRLHRQYAEAAGRDWAVLSAKHGFLWPGDLVPENYDVTFSSAGRSRRDRPASITTLMHQVRHLGLDRYGDVTVLGGKEYREHAEMAFLGTGCWLEYPFAGLAQGRELAAVRAAVDAMLLATAAAQAQPARGA